MEAGISQIGITPSVVENGGFLAGFGSRRASDSCRDLDGLYIRVAWLRNNGKNSIIINGDLCYFPDELCSKILDWITSEYGVPKESVILNATHTHSSLHPGGIFFDGSTQKPTFQEDLFSKIRKGIRDAFHDLKASRLYIAKTRCSVGINRRRKIIKVEDLRKMRIRRRVANRPNAQGQIDDDLYVIRIVKERTIAAILLNYACHASVLTGAFISADFPGRIRSISREPLDGEVPMFFLQGFAGNIRPRFLRPVSSFLFSPKAFLVRLIEGKQFEKNTSEKHIDEIGAQIASVIKSVPEEDYEEIDAELESDSIEVDLPLQEIPSKDYFLGLKPETPEERDWLGYVVKNYDKFCRITFKISRIDLGKGYSLLCMPGEVFCEYAIAIKKLLAPLKIIPLGYTNGMIGYIPTAQAIREGGYEVEKAHKIYGLPCSFSDKIENTIITAVKTLYGY